MNMNAALKMERETHNQLSQFSPSPPLIIDNSKTNMPKTAPPDSASMNFAAPKSLMSIQSQTSFPRWRRGMG